MDSSDRGVALGFFDHWLIEFSVFFSLIGLFYGIILRDSGQPSIRSVSGTVAGVALFDSRTPPSVERYQRFILGLLGTINTSYFMVMAFVAPVLFRRRELWVLAAVELSIGLWFVVDSASPLARGAVFDVLRVNVSCVIWMSAPLVALCQ